MAPDVRLPNGAQLAIALLASALLRAAALMPMRASAGDIAIFDAAIRCCLGNGTTNSTLYVEFGCGGSTDRVLSLTNASIVSIDSSSDWLAQVKQASSKYPGRFTSVHADIGPIKAWGYPKEPVNKSVAERYFSGLDTYLPRADLILIDGRWRIACAVRAAKLAREGAVIVIHDFYDRVATYAPVLRYLQIVDPRTFDPKAGAKCAQGRRRFQAMPIRGQSIVRALSRGPTDVIAVFVKKWDKNMPRIGSDEDKMWEGLTARDPSRL